MNAIDGNDLPVIPLEEIPRSERICEVCGVFATSLVYDTKRTGRFATDKAGLKFHFRKLHQRHLFCLEHYRIAEIFEYDEQGRIAYSHKLD